jgi:oxygen-independent coproporphyrinogen-3 oxidase
MFCDAAQALTDDGYVWVGIDNFARPHDDLAKAANSGTAGRNFSGSSPGRADNVIGVGPTVTSAFGRHYFQSTYDPRDYAAAIADGRFPVTVGYELSDDEALRRAVIFALQCRQRVDFAEFETQYGIDFASYFERELAGLAPFVADGMASRDGSGISVTTKGRFFVRHVCRLFDRFLADGAAYKIHGP